MKIKIHSSSRASPTDFGSSLTYKIVLVSLCGVPIDAVLLLDRILSDENVHLLFEVRDKVVVELVVEVGLHWLGVVVEVVVGVHHRHRERSWIECIRDFGIAFARVSKGICSVALFKWDLEVRKAIWKLVSQESQIVWFGTYVGFYFNFIKLNSCKNKTH